jgi:hypothetical protein
MYKLIKICVVLNDFNFTKLMLHIHYTEATKIPLLSINLRSQSFISVFESIPLNIDKLYS